MLSLASNLFVHVTDATVSLHSYQDQHYEIGVGSISLGNSVMKPKIQKGLKSGRQPEHHKSRSESRMGMV